MGRKTSYRGIKALGDGKYELTIHWTDRKTGRARKAVRIRKAKSVQDAARIREELRLELQASGAERPRRVRLADAVTSWLDTKLPTWKKSTRVQNASVLDEHILPALGDYFVDAIEPSDIVAWRDAQAAQMIGPAEAQRRVSATSVNSRLRLLRQVLADVCGEMSLPSPAARVPGVRQALDEAREAYYLDAGEARAALEWLRDSERWGQWFPLVALLALTGLRFGEATALRWSDLDEDGGWIHVRRAQWKGAVDHPKSRVSKRDVPLAPELAEILREHRRAQTTRMMKRAKRNPRAAQRMKAAIESGYIFVGNAGNLLHNSVLTKPVAAALEARKITGRFPAAQGWRRVHNNLLRQVTNEAVRQALIGHADAEVGREHYSKASHDELRAANAEVVRLVTGTKGGKG